MTVPAVIGRDGIHDIKILEMAKERTGSFGKHR